MCPSISEGVVIYHSDDSPESITEAREYIAKHGLTTEDVRLIRRGSEVMVISLREVYLGGVSG